MTSQPGKQTIVIHIFPDISRSKGNQTMKSRSFNRIFSENSDTQNKVEKLVPDPFLEN